ARRPGSHARARGLGIDVQGDRARGRDPILRPHDADRELPTRRGISRRQLLGAAGSAGAMLLLPRGAARAVAARPIDSAVVRWNKAFLQGVRESKLGPPMVARALAIAHTCIYDAWAAYDHKAVGTRLGGALRRPPFERTAANQTQALSFAAYRAAVDLFAASASSTFDPLMRDLGYDGADISRDTS